MGNAFPSLQPRRRVFRYPFCGGHPRNTPAPVVFRPQSGKR